MSRKSCALPPSPFRRFNLSPEIIRLVVIMDVRFRLWLRNIEDLPFEREIDICHEPVRLWRNRFGPMFAKVAMKRLGNTEKQELGRWANNKVENS